MQRFEAQLFDICFLDFLSSTSFVLHIDIEL